MDMLDVWIDSGSSSMAVLEPRGLPYPADVYLEGGDQFRGWFNSSLVVGLEAKGEPPYRAVITNGWAVDWIGGVESRHCDVKEHADYQLKRADGGKAPDRSARKPGQDRPDP